MKNRKTINFLMTMTSRDNMAATLMEKTKKFYTKAGDESVTMFALWALKLEQFQVLNEIEDHEQILDAIRRSTDALDDASIEDIAHYIQEYDSDQLDGFITNIKGIYHEIAFVEAENADNDGVEAILHEDTNHPGSDVKLVDKDTGHTEEISLKATDSKGYIEHAMEKYPQYEIHATEEVALEVPNAHSTGFSNAEITEDTFDVIHDMHDFPELKDAIPHVAFWTTAIAIYPVLKKWKSGVLTREKCIREIAKITGWKVVKATAFISLLSFPLTAAPTAFYLFLRILWGFYKVYKI